MPETRPKRGRPPSAIDETGLLLGYALGAGMSIDDAAKLAGVSRSSLYNWLAAGRFNQDPRFKKLAQLLAERDGPSNKSTIETTENSYFYRENEQDA